jgi:hypothetical protein
MNTRPIEPEMQLLWERLDNMADIVGGLIRAIVGEDRGFMLMVHPGKEGFATISISNLKSNREVVAAWLAAHDKNRS